MDKPVHDQSEGGVVKITGATTPTGFPHLCPYQPHGATVEICKDFTGNYQRNTAGCCGTSDFRAFAPCNSQFRKCHKCLLEGKGSRSGVVVDVPRGLCEDCAQAVDNPPKVAVSAKPVLYVPPKRSDISRPVWKPTPKPSVAAPAQVPVRPPVKVVQVVPTAVPGADELKARFAKLKAAKPPKVEVVQKRQSATPVRAAVDQIDLADLAKRIDKLTHRRKVVLAETCEKGRMRAAEALKLSEGSIRVYLSKILTELTLSYSPNSAFRKLTSKEKKERLFKAWELYCKESFQKNPPLSLVRRPRQSYKKRGLFPKESEMLELFRQMSSEEQDRYLKIGTDLLSKPKQ